MRRFAVALALLVVLSSVTSRALAESIHYPTGAIQSPMTKAVVERLRGVLAKSTGSKDVFVKVGDSNTVNQSFLQCFAGKDVKLGAHAALETTRAFFAAHKVDVLHGSFDRITSAATIGWLAANAIAGDPSPLSREIDAVKPAFAIVMLGTNDNRVNGLDSFKKSLADVVDRALAANVIPILSTIPPRADSAPAAARVPELNAFIRELAESRVVPMIDLYAALLPLKGYGLSGDGIHLQMASENDTPRGCWLTDAALEKGMNVRNLVTLTALDRMRRFVIGTDAPEKAALPNA